MTSEDVPLLSDQWAEMAAKHLRRLARAMRASGIAHATIDGVTITLDLSFVRRVKGVATPDRDEPEKEDEDRVMFAHVEGY